jgi:GNAT superfamily N-acetyltransferase
VVKLMLPAPEVSVRPARPEDPAAALVFDAAPTAYAAVAGSPERAREVLAKLWSKSGHSASFEHALVAEVDGRLAGVLIGFPARDRYKLHGSLLLKGLRFLPCRRLPMLAVALVRLLVTTPSPPRDAFYVATVAVAWHARRRGVASTLGYRAEVIAAARGFARIVAHTGSPNFVARTVLEHYGLTATKECRRGYVLYSKQVRVPNLPSQSGTVHRPCPPARK